MEQINIGVFSIQYSDSVLERRNHLEACPNLMIFAVVIRSGIHEVQ